MLGKDQTCANCIFYISEDKKSGVCRLHPPNLFLLGMKPGATGPAPITISMWPGVAPAQWCGDWGKRVEQADA